MYEELIQDLRDKAEFLRKTNYDSSIHNSFAETMSQAADAIEGISSLIDHYGGETGIKNLHEYADKYWEIVKNEKVGEQYNKQYAKEYCNTHPFL